MTEYSIIDTREGFHDAVKRLASATGPIAVDAERASGFRYSQRAYVIQVFRRKAGVFLFDPPAIGRFDELQEVLHNELWVLHAASQDLACLREVGLDPTKIFDTELAARLLGLPRVGLSSVVQELLGVELAKEHSAADWSTRPLPQAWLSYAALDVELLLDIYDALAQMLDNDNKSEIAEQEFHAVLLRQAKTPPSEPWRRLSGMHSLKGPRHLAIARELWTARDELAREKDSAPGRLLPDSSIVFAAGANPSSRRDLAGMKEFMGRASRSEINRWWDAIHRGQQTDDLPVPPERNEGPPPARTWVEKNVEADQRLKLARTRITQIAQERLIPVENLLTPSVLRRVAWRPPHPVSEETIALALTENGARAWQVEILAPVIAKTFIEAAMA